MRLYRCTWGADSLGAPGDTALQQHTGDETLFLGVSTTVNYFDTPMRHFQVCTRCGTAQGPVGVPGGGSARQRCRASRSGIDTPTGRLSSSSRRQPCAQVAGLCFLGYLGQVRVCSHGQHGARLRKSIRHQPYVQGVLGVRRTMREPRMFAHRSSNMRQATLRFQRSHGPRSAEIFT